MPRVKTIVRYSKDLDTNIQQKATKTILAEYAKQTSALKRELVKFMQLVDELKAENEQLKQSTNV